MIPEGVNHAVLGQMRKGDTVKKRFKLPRRAAELEKFIRQRDQRVGTSTEALRLDGPLIKLRFEGRPYTVIVSARRLTHDGAVSTLFGGCSPHSAARPSIP